MRRVQPVTIYPPSDLLNRVDRIAMAKERARTWVSVRAMRIGLEVIERRIERRKQRTT